MKEHCLGADFRITRLSQEQQKMFDEDNPTPNAWHYVKILDSDFKPVSENRIKSLESFQGEQK